MFYPVFVHIYFSKLFFSDFFMTNFLIQLKFLSIKIVCITACFMFCLKTFSCIGQQLNNQVKVCFDKYFDFSFNRISNLMLFCLLQGKINNNIENFISNFHYFQTFTFTQESVIFIFKVFYVLYFYNTIRGAKFISETYLEKICIKSFN